MTRVSIRLSALTATLVLLFALVPVETSQALPRPRVDPTRVPTDGKPGPAQPMRQSFGCARTITVAEPAVTSVAPGFSMLNVAKAWQYSTGNGVGVAVIDTGVTPSRRLPVVAGGDYIMGGDGLSDCDAHGTVLASIIGAAPQGIPMPVPMPEKPAFPAPVGPPPVDSGPAPEILGPAARMEAGSPAPLPDVEEGGDRSEVAPPGPDTPDGVAGVAPHAVVVSVRQSSRAFDPVQSAPGDLDGRRKAGTVATLASAIVHAANLGVQVINVSVTACVSSSDPLDESALGAALWYAATIKDAVVVSAAGNDSEEGCTQNALFDPLDVSDPRDWHQVKTVSLPSYFSDYVLSVGAVDTSGSALSRSLSGPWVAAAAPGVGIMGLSPQTGGPINAYPPIRLGDRALPIWGTSFSAAYVSGVVALVRARYPELSAHQVINRILRTAHNPPRGVDNRIGYGLVDPVAALTFDVPAGERLPVEAASRVIVPPAQPPAEDHRARTMALAIAAIMALLVVAAAAVSRSGRR